MSVLRTWFSHPLVLVLVGLLPVLGVGTMLARRHGRRVLARLGSTPAVDALVLARGRGVKWQRVCLAGGLLALLVGSAGPQWGRESDLALAPGRDLVVVLDLSRSMLAEDVLPNRLERAKRGLADLGDAMQRRGGHRVALVVFAAGARVACPLTHDYDHFRAAVGELDAAHPPPELRPVGDHATSGTRIGAGLRAAVEVHDPRFQGYQDILLLSDGDDPARDDEWRQGAEAAGVLHIPVHSVGIGAPDQASTIPLPGDEILRHKNEVVRTRLEERPLEAIARLSGGSYTPARTQLLSLGQLFRERIEPQAVNEETDDALPVYRQRYPWFLAAALLLLSLEMLASRRMVRQSAVPQAAEVMG